MKINFKIDINNLSMKSLNLSEVCRKAEIFFYKKIQFFIIALFFLVATYLVFIWYVNIYNSKWSEEQVNEYIQTKQNKSEAIFNRNNFEKVIQESKERSEEFEKTLDNFEDIFRIKK